MRKLWVSTFVLALFIASSSFGAFPASGSTTTAVPSSVVDRELVTIDMYADGKIARKSMVDSLSVYGNGSLQVTDRNEPRGLRNLSGFQAPASVSGENLTWNVNVAGEKQLLTVAPQVNKPMPISVTPKYFIGTKQVSAADIRGHTGTVTIEYTLHNATGKTQSFEVVDKTGKKVTKQLETYVPFVAQTSFELPAGMWRSIDAQGASIVTDDNNLNHVTFTSLLMPLVGNPTQTVRLSGRVTDLELSETRIVFQPLLPGGAAETAARTFDGANKLFSGVGQVDANLLKLQAGTLALIDGLEKLYRGILDAQAGLGSVGKSDTIVDGLKRVLDGLKSLGATTGMPAIKAGVDSLAAAIGEVLVGLGSTSQPSTILGGLSQVSGGLGALGAPAGLPAAKGGVDAVNAGLAQASAALTGLQAAVGGSVAEIQGALALLGCPAVNPTACGLLDSALNSSHGLSTVTLPGLSALSTGTTAAIGGLTLVSSGLASAIGAVGQLGAGVTAVSHGVEQVKAGLKSGSASNPGILEGLQSVAGGLTKAIAGIGTVGASDTLTDGADRLLTGSQDLATGVGQIATGTNDARSGAAQIGGGQADLSAKGTKVIQSGVGDNILEASSALAVLAAMKDRAANESALYGPPAGSAGSTTYVVRVGPITAKNVETVIKFAVAALLLFILAGAGLAATRRTLAAV